MGLVLGWKGFPISGVPYPPLNKKDGETSRDFELCLATRRGSDLIKPHVIGVYRTRAQSDPVIG